MTTDTQQPPWRKILSAYQTPKLFSSLFEIIATLGPLLMFWSASFYCLSKGMEWSAFLITIPASVFMVRMFLIQHDCGHHSFFKSIAINNWVGRAIGVLTFTPYDVWRRQHAIHHAASGNLDRRGLGAIDTLTIEEFNELTPMGKLWYKFYRHPITLFVIGPFYIFFIEHRVPSGIMKEGWRPWVSALGTNVGIASLVTLLVMTLGWNAVLLVLFPTVFFAAALGVWLFYVQHQFEEVEWFRNDEWNHTHAALAGSSFYDLPKPLDWLTGNIGIHHVHHAASKIPFYLLPKVLKDHPALADMNRLTMKASVKTIPLTLWDEENRMMISFKQLKRRTQAA